MTVSQPNVAMIGAGISGLVCAGRLQAAGLQVKVFEKSRGVGGRMSTRRAEGDRRFDHGAQYFTVRDPEFERFLREFIATGAVTLWSGRIVDLVGGQVEAKQQVTPRYVGVPGMNALCKHLATDLEVQFRTRAVSPVRAADRWQLHDDQGQLLGDFDCVLTSAPAPQSAQLLASAPDLQRQARSTPMRGCWAAMVSFAEPLGLPLDGAFVQDSPLSWVSRNQSKPQRDRGGHECWVLQASAEWSEQHMEEAADKVLSTMLNAFWDATAETPQPITFGTAHRWRYAIPPEPLAGRCLFDSELRLGACGDWCGGPRVEGAFLSGLALANRILAEPPAYR